MISAPCAKALPSADERKHGADKPSSGAQKQIRGGGANPKEAKRAEPFHWESASVSAMV